MTNLDAMPLLSSFAISIALDWAFKALHEGKQKKIALENHTFSECSRQ